MTKEKTVKLNYYETVNDIRVYTVKVVKLKNILKLIENNICFDNKISDLKIYEVEFFNRNCYNEKNMDAIRRVTITEENYKEILKAFKEASNNEN